MGEQGKTRTGADTKGYWDKWSPRSSDIQWLKNLLNACNENATWQTSEGTFKINKKAMTLTLVQGDTGQIYWRTRKVAARLGWTVDKLEERN